MIERELPSGLIEFETEDAELMAIRPAGVFEVDGIVYTPPWLVGTGHERLGGGPFFTVKLAATLTPRHYHTHKQGPDTYITRPGAKGEQLFQDS